MNWRLETGHRRRERQNAHPIFGFRIPVSFFVPPVSGLRSSLIDEILYRRHWQIFKVGESALAGWSPTALQVLVVITAIILTYSKERISFLSYRKQDS